MTRIQPFPDKFLQHFEAWSVAEFAPTQRMSCSEIPTLERNYMARHSNSAGNAHPAIPGQFRASSTAAQRFEGSFEGQQTGNRQDKGQ